MSVTIYQDGPDLANQGTLAACQVPVQSMKVPLSWLNVAGTGVEGCQPIEFYAARDMPDFASMQNMPNAYVNKSKEGLYLPLHLTHTHQVWRSEADSVFETNGLAPAGGATGFVGVAFAAHAANFPHTDLNVIYITPGVGSGGDVTSPMCNDAWGHIAARNCAVTTQFAVYVRAGYEIQCQPGSPYTPQLCLSPPHDAQAIEAYFLIAREMKDAYPADFNDLGKIWAVIKDVAKKVSPFIRIVPGVGPAVSSLLDSAPGAIDGIINAVKRVTASGRASAEGSAADKERVSQALGVAQRYLATKLPAAAAGSSSAPRRRPARKRSARTQSK